MRLFDKRNPCAICGGKVKGLLPHKINGQVVCGECYGEVDLPANVECAMTVEQFCEYRAYREENNKLKADFRKTSVVDLGVLATKAVFDLPKRLMCLDKNLDKTVFHGSEIVSFSIWEDSLLVCEGSANGLNFYPSPVMDRAMAMAPQIERFRMRAMMQRAGGKDAPPAPMFDIPEPLTYFHVKIHFNHPYWSVFETSVEGPRFNNSYPDLNEYLRHYQEQAREFEQLALNMAEIAFSAAPEAPQPAAPAETEAPAVDTVTELQRYKALLDQGILTEEEFTAKKKLLLGI